MPWFKIDDGFYTSRKVLSIPRTCRLAAVGLWTMAGNWSARELTDGVVPEYVLAEVGATSRLRQALVEARLWLDHGSAGIEFYEWASYQPTRAQIEHEREKERIRKEKWRSSRGDTDGTPPSVPAVSRGVSRQASGHPDPTRPDPTLTTTSNEVVERPAKRGSRLSPNWLPSPESIEKIRQEAPGVDPKAEHSMFVDYWIAQPGQKGVKTDWDATWRNWMRRKQADLKAGRKPKDQQVIDILEQGRQMQAMEDRRAIG